jgi:hypothetical protein
MKRENQIPYYASDGTSLGFRAEEAARRLVAGGFVQASYGRKGHLKAIWSRPQDGSSPVETRPPSGTRPLIVREFMAVKSTVVEGNTTMPGRTNSARQQDVAK